MRGRHLFEDMTHTLNDAVCIARRLEHLIFERFALHIAIGGSCVYRGTSEKDVDIFLYPHTKETPIDRLLIMEWLMSQGFTPRSDVNGDHTQVPDVLVTIETATGIKADFFFLERHTVLKTEDEKQTPSDFLQL